MNYSLVNRFEGCLLGVVCGEQFGRAALSSYPDISSPLCRSNLDGSNPNGFNLDGSNPLPHDWREPLPPNFSLAGSKMLLQVLQAINQAASPLAEITLSELRPMSSNGSAGAVAIATLPIALYYHDDLHRQQQALRQVLPMLALDAVAQDWVLIFAYAIAQLLRGQFHAAQFLSQIAAYYRVAVAVAAPSALVLTALEQVAKCQLESATITEIQGRLKSADPASDVSVPLALIYFLQTPENFRLALSRSALGAKTAAQTDPAGCQLACAPLVCSLTGALVGALVGSVGVPPAWKLSDPPTTTTDFLAPIMAEAHQLFIRWSGVYRAAASANSLAVAAPWVFRGQSPE